MTFITGVAEQYDLESYDAGKLGKLIKEDDYKYAIDACNLSLRQYWPCNIAICIGYFLAPFCFGLSLLLPNVCIRDAKANLLQTVLRMNVLKLKDKGLLLSYR